MKFSPNLQVNTQRPRYSKENVERVVSLWAHWPPLKEPILLVLCPLRRLFGFEQIHCQLILFSFKVAADLNLPGLPFLVFAF